MTGGGGAGYIGHASTHTKVLKIARMPCDGLNNTMHSRFSLQTIPKPTTDGCDQWLAIVTGSCEAMAIYLTIAAWLVTGLHNDVVGSN